MHKSYYLLLIYFFSISFYAQEYSDNYWQKISKVDNKKAAATKRSSMPNNYELYTLKLALLNRKLAQLNTVSSINGNTIAVQLPMPNGAMETFEVKEKSMLAPQLQQKFSKIKSYTGKGTKNTAAVVKISVSKNTFYAMVIEPGKPTFFIDPYAVKNSTYISYSKNELPAIEHFQCMVEEQSTEANKNQKVFSAVEGPNDSFLRQFRLAVACTGEYAQFQLEQQGIPSTASETEKKEAVLAAINATMTRVNAIFQRDLAIEMLLVANNTDVIFLDPNTDPFSNNNSNLLIDESQATIDNNIGFNNYDIGHTFSTGGGGLAEISSVCTSGKARGITGSSFPLGDAYDIDFVAHEMGHQFGAHHTFNGDAGNCTGNRNDNTAVEPGSGSTIMSYAGLCASQNIQPLVGSYFHGVSIDEIWQNITNGNSTCANLQSISNTAPTANAGNNYTIPILTPFVLKGEANDVNADNLTYCWEQVDNEIYQFPLESTETGGAVFRSFPPTTSPNRFIPNYTSVLNNMNYDWEVLPSVSRELNFLLTVRNNNATAGQIAQDNTVLNVDANYGPFEITSQSNEGIIWPRAVSRTITWNVNNTNNLAGAQNVNILLSTDGGQTFPTVLSSNTPNDGSEPIVVPNQSAPYCRIKIEPAGDQIFYAINKVEFAIDYSLESNCFTNSNSTQLPITDGTSVFDSSKITVTENQIVKDVNVYVDISHTYVEDLTIKLISPQGTQVNLYSRLCGDTDDLKINFDDEGAEVVCTSNQQPTEGVFKPSELLSALNNENSQGEWTLLINDGAADDTGVLNEWRLEICYDELTELDANHFELTDFKIYPNPIGNFLNISFNSYNTLPVEVAIYNMLGQLVYIEKYNNLPPIFSEEISLKALSPGTYIVKINQGDTTIKKLMVKK